MGDRPPVRGDFIVVSYPDREPMLFRVVGIGERAREGQNLSLRLVAGASNGHGPRVFFWWPAEERSDDEP